jgi:O-antigen/teichoic acid export membrane protein
MSTGATIQAPRRVARNAAARAGGEIVAKLGSLAFFVTMAREIGARGFGEFQFALALTGALVIVAGFGTDNLLAREVARDLGRAGRLLADAAAVKLLGGILAVGIAAVVVSVGGYSGEERLAVYIVGIGSLLEVGAKSWYSIFQAYERLELVSANLILQRVSTAAAGIVVLLLGGGVVAASAVYAAGTVLAVVAADRWARRLGVVRPRLDPSGWLPLVRAAIPIGLISLLAALLARVDVAMLSFLGDATKVGTYAAGFRLVDSTQFLGSALSAAMLPWLARAGGSHGIGLARGYGLGLKAIVVLLLPVALSLALFAEPLIRLVYGSGFSGGVSSLQLLALMTLTYGINVFAATALIARDRPAAYAQLFVPVIALNVGLNFVLIPRYGPGGAAFDTVLSSTLLALLALRQARLVLGRADLVGAFAGAALGGGAMAALVLAARAPWPAEAALGLAVYAAVLACFEWLMRRDDVNVFLRALPARLASRGPAGRTTA